MYRILAVNFSLFSIPFSIFWPTPLRVVSVNLPTCRGLIARAVPRMYQSAQPSKSFSMSSLAERLEIYGGFMVYPTVLRNENHADGIPVLSYVTMWQACSERFCPMVSAALSDGFPASTSAITVRLQVFFLKLFNFNSINFIR